jgi:hemolysin activation/secretion protein
MPWETTLLWKNTFQYTNYNLVASEQFQIGGATSVRGYPPAEHAGDKGLYTALELSMPVYPVSKDAYVPFTTDVKLYDALRFVAFYDWGTTHINTIIAGEKKHQTLKGVGCGVRLNVKDNLSFRVELGWPLGGRTPSDGDHMHPWFELIWKI